MKKLILLLLLIPSLAWGQVSTSGVSLSGCSSGGAAAGGASCATTCATMNDCLWIDELHTDDFTNAGGSIDKYSFVGQANFSPGGAKVVCQVDMNIRNVTGSATTWYFEIYEMNGTSLGTLNSGCTSDSKSINGAGTVSFTGLSCTLDNAKTYGLVITRTDRTYNADNYLGAGVYVATTTNMNISGSLYSWNTDKTKADYMTADLSCKVYGYTP